MEFGASAEDIARTCHAHPTLPEAVKEAAHGGRQARDSYVIASSLRACIGARAREAVTRLERMGAAHASARARGAPRLASG